VKPLAAENLRIEDDQFYSPWGDLLLVNQTIANSSRFLVW
jgi:hypothetical protein